MKTKATWSGTHKAKFLALAEGLEIENSEDLINLSIAKIKAFGKFMTKRVKQQFVVKDKIILLMAADLMVARANKVLDLVCAETAPDGCEGCPCQACSECEIKHYTAKAKEKIGGRYEK